MMKKSLLRSLLQTLTVAACALLLVGFNLEAQAGVDNDNHTTASVHAGKQQKKRRRVRRRARSARQPVARRSEIGTVSGGPPPVVSVVKGTADTTPSGDAPFGDPNTKAPSTSAQPARKPPGKPIIGGVLNGKAIDLPIPRYPAIARSARASGTVVVEVIVNERGKVISAHAISGHPLLQQASVEAAYGARFSPTLLSGQPVKVTGIITFNFVQ